MVGALPELGSVDNFGGAVRDKLELGLGATTLLGVDIPANVLPDALEDLVVCGAVLGVVGVLVLALTEAVGEVGDML